MRTPDQEPVQSDDIQAPAAPAFGLEGGSTRPTIRQAGQGAGRPPLALSLRPPERRLSDGALVMLILLLCLAAQPAAAQVIAEIGTEFASWQSVFDGAFVPIAITAGLLLALIAAMFSRIAGVVVFVFTVAGAAAYGLRDQIVALAA